LNLVDTLSCFAVGLEPMISTHDSRASHDVSSIAAQMICLGIGAPSLWWIPYGDARRRNSGDLRPGLAVPL